MATPNSQFGFTEAQTTMNVMKSRGFGRAGDKQAEGFLAQKQKIDDRAAATIQTMQTREKGIRTDGRFTPAGQVEQFRQLAKDALKEFTFIGKEIDATREAMNRLKTVTLDYLTLPTNADKQIQYWREMEIRQTLRPLPIAEQQQAFLAGAERLDWEFMRACLTGPGLPLIRDLELVVRAEELYGQRRDPKAWATQQSLGIYLDYLLSVARLVSRALLTWGADRASIEKTLSITLPLDPQQAQLAREAAAREQAAKAAGRG